MFLYATDYDGTVTPILKEEREKVIEAIHRWRSLGNLFGIVTGRPIDSIRREILHYSIPTDFTIANNGAIITDGTGKLLVSHPIAREDAEALLRRIDSDGFHSWVRSDTEAYHITSENGRAPLSFLSSDLPSSVFSGSFTEISTDFADIDSCLAFSKEMDDRFAGRIRCLVPSPKSVDCVAAGVNKAAGIKETVRLLGVDPEKIFVTGDSHNDLDMLLCPDFCSYAVENALPQVKEAVGRTVESPLALLLSIMGK